MYNDFDLDENGPNPQVQPTQQVRHARVDIPKEQTPDKPRPIGVNMPDTSNRIPRANPQGRDPMVPGEGWGNPLVGIAKVLPVKLVVSKPMDALTILGVSHCIIIVLLVISIACLSLWALRRYRKDRSGYRDAIRKVSGGHLRENGDKKRRKFKKRE